MSVAIIFLVPSLLVLFRQHLRVRRRLVGRHLESIPVGLWLRGLKSPACEAEVETILHGVYNVIRVASVSYKQKRADIIVRTGTDIQVLIDILREHGFQAKVSTVTKASDLKTCRIGLNGLSIGELEEDLVSETLGCIDGVVKVHVSPLKSMVVVLSSLAVEPETLVAHLKEIGFSVSSVETETAEQKGLRVRNRLKVRKSGMLRHACFQKKIDEAALEKAFTGIQSNYHEQKLQQYSRYDNWTQSCYMECHKSWAPRVSTNLALREVMKPVLDMCAQIFETWYKELYGLKSVEVITLNSFVTKYVPSEGKDEFGKHVDSAKCDGSLILALPTDDSHDWPGLKVWDKPTDRKGDGMRVFTYVLQPGDICCLDKLVWHHGLPISKGVRYVAVCFYKVLWKRVG